MAFEGFTDQTFDWFGGLMLDNSKDYFTKHKPLYEQHVVKPLTDLLQELSAEFGGKPKLFRPYRDIRFAKDKSPFKTNAGGLLVERSRPGALYTHIDFEGFFAAAGYYNMEADRLRAFRLSLTEDDDALANGQVLLKIIDRLSAKGYEPIGDRMKTTPRGVDKNHPNADLLKFKSMAFRSEVLKDDLVGSRDPLKATAQFWHDCLPLLGWLNLHAELVPNA